MDSVRLLAAFAVTAAVVGAALASAPRAQGPTRPRPGLTAQQTKEAVNLTKGAMTELRKKTEGATTATADRREYVVGVELLVGHSDDPRPDGESATTSGKDAEKTKSEPEKKEIEKGKEDEKAKAKAGPDRWRSSPGIGISTTSRSFQPWTSAGPRSLPSRLSSISAHRCRIPNLKKPRSSLARKATR